MPKETKLVKGLPIAKFSGKGKSVLSKLPASEVENTSLLVLLSIKGNRRCTGIELQLMLEKAIQDHKKQIICLIGDEVYWHNLAEPGDSDNPEVTLLRKQEAITLGDQYLQDNLPFFLNALNYHTETFEFDNLHVDTFDNISGSITEQLDYFHQEARRNNIPIQIMRWNEWINDRRHDFHLYQSEIMQLYETVPTLKAGIVVSTTDFVNRHKKSCDNPERIRLLKQQSEAYLLEESPAIIWIAGKLGFNFLAYPGKMLKSVEASKDFFMKDFVIPQFTTAKGELANMPICEWLEVDFKIPKASASMTSNQNIPSNRTSLGSTDKENSVSSSPLSQSPNFENKRCDSPWGFVQLNNALGFFEQKIRTTPLTAEEHHVLSSRLNEMASLPPNHP